MAAKAMREVRLSDAAQARLQSRVPRYSIEYTVRVRGAGYLRAGRPHWREEMGSIELVSESDDTQRDTIP